MGPSVDQQGGIRRLRRPRPARPPGSRGPRRARWFALLLIPASATSYWLLRQRPSHSPESPIAASILMGLEPIFPPGHSPQEYYSAKAVRIANGRFYFPVTRLLQGGGYEPSTLKPIANSPSNSARFVPTLRANPCSRSQLPARGRSRFPPLLRPKRWLRACAGKRTRLALSRAKSIRRRPSMRSMEGHYRATSPPGNTVRCRRRSTARLRRRRNRTSPRVLLSVPCRWKRRSLHRSYGSDAS